MDVTRQDILDRVVETSATFGTDAVDHAKQIFEMYDFKWEEKYEQYIFHKLFD